MHSPTSALQPKIIALSMGLTLVTLWSLTQGYHGLTGDGQIYAFQAFAKIHPQLAVDLYLQNTSQDQFTIFSTLYAWCIGLMGLEDGARLLTIVFTTWFMAAAWSLAQALGQRHSAWLAVAFLLIIPGDYGGSGVFHVSEPFLTARLPAEALIITALSCQFWGRPRLGLLTALGSFFVHPLIALPGLLLLFCLRLPARVGGTGAIIGVLATLVMAITAAMLPLRWPVLTTMDSPWLEVVRERSQFLFLQLWSTHDWEVNVRPFIYLAFTAVAVPDARVRRLCMAAALVGGAGLAVALIASVIAPVAILIQGQAWRWLWIAVFVSALLLPATIIQVWREQGCGSLCAILLVSGWTLPVVDGTACVSLALALWIFRTRLSARASAYLRWVSAALGGAIAAWVLIKTWAIVSPAPASRGHESFGAAQIRDFFGLKIPAMLFVLGIWWWIRTNRTIWAPTVLSAILVACSMFILPVAFRQSRTLAAASDIDEFADWTDVIPPTSTVLVAPSRDVGAFVWFTLQRPNYLALNQSSGVVFSRATALEVQRRSQVLLPLMDPSWKILTSLQTSSGNNWKDTMPPRPLTAMILMQVCSDPQLGFVISPQDVGLEALRHRRAGAFKDWNLYDCRSVRSVQATT